jgi:glycosyltransferase involved in cell wall biosynthesis
VGLTIPIVHLPHFAPLTEGALPTGDHPVGEKAATPYFLFVGRLEKLKGVQTLIPIFRRYPGAQLWIAGTGSYEPQLRGLAAGSGNIRFLGHLSDQQLRVVYRGAVALIVPSIWYEVFGLVIIEAFSQRTPAVVRNLGGMPELIEESGGGFVYETDKELLAAMDRLLADSSLRHEMGLHGYEAYLKKWTADVHMQAYLELIHDMAAAKAQTAVGTSPR